MQRNKQNPTNNTFLCIQFRSFKIYDYLKEKIYSI